MLITDLYTSMERLIKTILSHFVKVAVVKEAGNDLAAAQYSLEVQLSDLDLFIGTEARTALVTIEEDIHCGKIALFYK